VTPEGRIQKKAIDFAKGLGFLARRNYVRAGGEQGWPDVEFYLPGGRVILIEFKAPGGTPSKLQLKRIENLRALGHEAYVCDNVADAKEILSRGNIRAEI
jgi:hypothetical protein